jgi:hypothetical protein
MSSNTAHPEPDATTPGPGSGRDWAPPHPGARQSSVGPLPPTPAGEDPMVARGPQWLRSLGERPAGELIGAALATAVALMVVGALINTFAHVPHLPARARIQAALDFAQPFLAVVVLLGVVALWLLGRTALGGGRNLRRDEPFRAGVAGSLGLEAAIIGAGAVIRIIIDLTFLASGPASALSGLLGDLAVLPIVGVTLIWAWSSGIANSVVATLRRQSAGGNTRRRSGHPPAPVVPTPAAGSDTATGEFSAAGTVSSAQTVGRPPTASLTDVMAPPESDWTVSVDERAPQPTAEGDRPSSDSLSPPAGLVPPPPPPGQRWGAPPPPPPPRP